MHHRDHRLGQIVQPQPVLHIALQHRPVFIDGAGRGLSTAAQIVAGGKGTPGAADDQHFEVGISRHYVDGLSKFPNYRPVQGVEFLGAVQGERPNPVLLLESHNCQRHTASFSGARSQAPVCVSAILSTSLPGVNRSHSLYILRLAWGRAARAHWHAWRQGDKLPAEGRASSWLNQRGFRLPLWWELDRD